MTNQIEFQDPIRAYEGVKPCPRCRADIHNGDMVRWEAGEGRYWHDTCYQTATGNKDTTVTSDDSPDLVNHPPHYRAHPSGVECIDIVEHMGFNLGNAIKYIWRADEKGDANQDLEKADWYIRREIERRKKERG